LLATHLQQEVLLLVAVVVGLFSLQLGFEGYGAKGRDGELFCGQLEGRATV